MEALLNLHRICCHLKFTSQEFSVAVLGSSFVASQLLFGSQGTGIVILDWYFFKTWTFD